jgi:predicted GIY-YIG superfamily endonuclease
MLAGSDIAQAPGSPAIYAMHGGDGRRYLPYVGIGDDLRRRVTQHLVNRDSSVTTGTGAVSAGMPSTCGLSSGAYTRSPRVAEASERA